MNRNISASQLHQAIQNTIRPVINQSNQFQQAFVNSKKKTPHCECGANDYVIEPAKEQKNYGTNTG